jgi:hypothetical protein
MLAFAGQRSGVAHSCVILKPLLRWQQPLSFVSGLLGMVDQI